MSALLRLPFLLVFQLYQSLFLALAQIWANKLRSFLTTIGIVIGVASVTTVIAALTGLKTNVLKEFENFGTNKIFISPLRPEFGPKRHATWSVLRLEPEQFDGLLEHCPSLKAFTRMTRGNVTVAHGNRSAEGVEILGIEAMWHDVERRGVILGRPFTWIDNAHSRPVCLVNPTLQEKLALAKDPIGQQVIINERRYSIVGVVEPRPESAMFGGQGGGGEVLVPFSTIYRDDNPFQPLFVQAASKSPAVSEEAKAEIMFFLRRTRHLRADEPPTFRVDFVAQFVEQFNKIATAITLVAGGIVGISLIVGGVGIMNIMLVSVSERTREIGLRKAVGAPPAAICMQFLVEAVMLCCVGGLVGLAIAQLLTMILAKIPNAQLQNAFIPGWAVALAFGFSASVGLAFGMFPAIKAARLDPIEALRHE
jgi:putative ABC transport system permease protein